MCAEHFELGDISLDERAETEGRFCRYCLSRSIWAFGASTTTHAGVLNYIRGFSGAIERIPPQQFCLEDLGRMPARLQIAAVKARQTRPSTDRVKELFGTWLKALMASGLVGEEAERTSRGTRCLARDGHLCHSLGEKTIDDLLYAAGIEHEREPYYPQSRMRGDFLIGSTIVEYLGLAGDPAYDSRTRDKQRLARRHGVKLILLRPENLANPIKLRKIFRNAVETGD